MGMADVFNKLGEQIIPSVARKVFPDSMNILRESKTSDGGGGVISTGLSAINPTPIPCTYEPFTDKGYKAVGGDALTSTVQYKITFPTNQNGALIGILPSDKIRVLSRGNQTEKTFRVIGIKNDSGVIYEAVTEFEDAV